MSPNAAPGAGSSMVPHVNQVQIVRLDDDVAQWAIPLPLRLLTTVYVVTFSVELELDEIVIPDGGELTTSLVVFTVADGIDGIFPIIGVAGALYIPVSRRYR